MRVFEEEAKKIGAVEFLAQGTIYPDVIESGTGQAAIIKSHHNVGGLPDCVEFKQIIEPLRLLFKDEVRQLGRELGLPEYLVMRQPFPGPGLAIRVMGEITRDKLDILREADAIFRGEIEETGQSKRLWQYFATLADNPAEDGRNMVVTLRAVQVCEGSAAMAARLPYDLLEKVVQLIRERVPQVRRVVYDLTPSSNYKAVEWR